MASNIRVVGIALALGVVASAANAQGNEIAAINSAVNKCIAVARKHPDPYGMSKGFDAFYNASTGKVENNAYLQGQQPALFDFNKCMAASGYPLGGPPQKSN